MEQHLLCGLLYTDYDVFDSNKNKLTQSYLTSTFQQCPQGSGLMPQIFRGKVPILTLTTCFRKELFDMYIPVGDYVKYRFPLEDWPTFLILSKYTEIHYLPISTSTYRKGHDSISNPTTYEKIKKKLDGEHIMYKYLCQRFPEDLNYVENNYLNYQDLVFLNLCYIKGDFKTARKYSIQIHQRGYYNLKSKMALNLFTFYCFRFIKKVKNMTIKI